MTFAVRQLNLQFTTGGNSPISLDGLRATAVITNPGGNNAFGQLQLRVYGMTLDQMNTYSSTGANMVLVNNQSIVVTAGDEGTTLNQVFGGNIVASFIDFSSVPDVAFVCSAVAGYANKGIPAAGLSWQGAQNAETIIESLATSIGFTFQNFNKAHAILENQITYGSIVDQMQTIARNARIPIAIENGKVAIWPNTGGNPYRDNVEININAQNGLVGYPSYWESGFIIKTQFNPQILMGRRINLNGTPITKANGVFPIQSITHELSTLTPDGPWFTITKLAPPPYVRIN